MASKQRLDLLVVEHGLAPSREKARAMIMAGEVLVNGAVADKAGMQVSKTAEITISGKPRFVSRGGEKLAAALDAFPVRVQGRVCADVGASTGGFSDCLLQQDAAKVYAIDVGYGQLAHIVRSNPRVVVMERINARYIEKLPEPVELVVIDASFISLRLLLPVVLRWMPAQGDVIALIKPQFEAGQHDVGKGGVVRNPAVHRRVLFEVLSFAQNINLQPGGLIISPLKGPAGNIEFLTWLSKSDSSENQTIDTLITDALGKDE